MEPAKYDGPAKNVIEAICRVKAELPGIGKNDRGEGVPYSFRGIETLTAHLQGLTARHGVVIVQQSAMELPSGYEYLSSTNRVWHETHIQYSWAVYGPGGITDVIYGESIGFGRDDQDKGASKASTGAFKEFLIKLFCIGDKTSDGDTHTTEAQSSNGNGGEPAGRTFGTGEPPEEPRTLIDWHALGWAESPIPDTTEGSKIAEAARKAHDLRMKCVADVLREELDEAAIETLLADRKKTIGSLPFSVAKVETWEKMADARIREVKGEVDVDGTMADAFPGSEEVPTDVNQDPA